MPNQSGNDIARPEERLVRVPIDQVTLLGNLSVPANAHGAVLFAHGSGSGRHSSRNRYVAQVLQAGGLATLLIDLLTAEEEVIDARTAHLRFDVCMLALRLLGAREWLAQQATTRDMAVGCFGASTGGGAALIAAAERPAAFAAVVSRGGRPDLAGPALARVQTPTLLIVGGNDSPVARMNEEALAQITAPKQLAIVPGASHLFEEPGALEQVAQLARDWFLHYLAPLAHQRGGPA